MDREAEEGNWNGLLPEVLDIIFQHLPMADLLSCSVVSKNWKKTARDVLKRSRECYAYIKCFHQDIQDLNQMIASTDIMEMVNGLHIRNEVRPQEEVVRSDDEVLWHKSIRCTDVSNILQSDRDEGWKLAEAKQNILSVLGGQWQYLDLDMGYGRGYYVVSFGKGLLLREIILATSDTLQKLVIGQDRDWKFIPCCAKSFPKLKVIQVKQERVQDCCLDNSLSNFAPNLEKITGAMMRLNLICPENRFILERIKNIKVVLDLEVPQGEAREVFRYISGLYGLNIQHCRCEEYGDDEEEQDLTSWPSFVSPFVLRSLKTLKELRMYTLGLNNLSMESEGLKFPNLQRLRLATHRSVSMANEIWALKNLNLPKLCPKLEELELKEAECDHYVEDDDVVPGGEADWLDQSNMSVAIDLKCRDGLYNHEHLEFLSTIYPKLRKVRILNLGDVVDFQMSKIFWKLQSLEYLEINVLSPCYEIEFGIEALLCGINIEEAKLPWLTYQKKEDKLNLCIVPIRPSLLNARSLKELKITQDRQTVQYIPMVSCSWVTQVTENLPERRMRHMTVTFDGSKSLFDRLNRMRAFTMLQANKIRERHLE